MDVVLISARSAQAEPHWSRAVAADVARALAATGASVRWLCLCRLGETVAVAALDRVERQDLPAAVPPFRGVEARVTDNAMDVVLAKELRRRPPDVVVHLGAGAPSSANALWLADRMGARAVGVVRAPELLCHRGDFVDERGQACTSVLDAARCTACCTAASPSGLSPGQARAAACLRFLGGLSPYPSPVQFLNRGDLLFASLQLAGAVVTGDAAEAALLERAGLPARSIVTTDGAGLVATVVSAVQRVVGLRGM
jgi:hypothetical protein